MPGDVRSAITGIDWTSHSPGQQLNKL